MGARCPWLKKIYDDEAGRVECPAPLDVLPCLKETKCLGKHGGLDQEHDKIDMQQATLADNNPRPAISDLRETVGTQVSGCCDVGHPDSAGDIQLEKLGDGRCGSAECCQVVNCHVDS